MERIGLILALLFSALAHGADQIAFKTGVGTTTDTKSAVYSIGFENKIQGDSFYKLDFGAWTDNEATHQSAPFFSPVVGYHLGDADGFSFNPVFGILIMGYPDSVLGSPFNFTEELAIGYKHVSIGWKHISNGGTASPNKGRDYLFLNIGFPLN